MSLIHVFFMFMYIGACTIGGGLVGISVMQQVLLPTGLITEEEFFSMIAVAESTPGPIGVNMATFIGYKLHGVIGGVVVTIGLILPAFIVILIIARFAKSFKDSPIVQKSFYGIRPAATGMIGVAAWSIMSITVINMTALLAGNFVGTINIKQALFFIIATILMRVKKIHPILFIVAGAIFGIVLL